MNFHPGWLGHAEGFDNGGYYARDGCYAYISHQQDKRTSRQENWTVQNGKSDHPISLKAATVPGHQHEQGVPKDGSSADRSGSI
jgi:hypothetical protein